MAELERKDIISDEALMAPLVLNKNFETLLATIMKVKSETAKNGAMSESATNINTTTTAISNLVDQEKEMVKIQNQLASAIAKENDEYIKYKKAVDDANARLKNKIALGEKDAQTINKTNASLKELQAALNKNRQAYALLATEEARSSTEGKKLLSVIQQQDKEVKELNQTMGKFQDNVGNYPSTFGKAAGSLQQIAPAATSAAQGIWGMVRAALAFIATPIGAVIAAVGAAIYALTAYFRGSEEGQNRLNKIIAIGSALFEQFMNVVEAVGEAVFNAFADPKQAVIDLWNVIKTNIVNRLEGLLELFPAIGKAISLAFKGNFVEAGKVSANALLKITTGVDDAVGKMGEFITATENAAKAGYDFGVAIADAEAKIDKAERALVESRSKTALEVAKKREEAISLEGDAKRKAIEEAIALETKLSDTEVKQAQTRLKLAELKRDANGDDKEALMEVSKATAAVYDAEKLRYENTLKFRKEIEKLDDDERERRQKSVDEKVKAFREQEQAAIQASKTEADAETAAFEKAISEGEAEYQALKKQREKAAADKKAERQQELDDIREFTEQAAAYVTDAANAVDTVQSLFSERRMNQLQTEQDALQAKYENDIALAGDNEERKEEIINKFNAQNKKLEQDKIAAQRKQAVFDKAISAVQASIATALAVTRLGVITPQAIAAGIFGAVQVAAILTKPIPAFAIGTDNSPEGLALVGEKGAELKVEPSGKMSLTPGVPTLDYLKAGTQIIPHDETMKMLALSGMGSDFKIQRKKKNEWTDVSRKLDVLNNTIRNKKEMHINFSRKGAEAMMRNAETRQWFLNEFYR